MGVEKILHILLINSDENQMHGKPAPDCAYMHWCGSLIISLIFVIIGQVEFMHNPPHILVVSVSGYNNSLFPEILVYFYKTFNYLFIAVFA
jgi:hypothetical protein